MSNRIETFTGPASEWDEFALRQQGGTHCHRLGWKRVIEEVLGHELLPLCLRDGAGALAGVLPLVSMRSMLFGRFLVSMPFLNYGGPLGTPEGIQALAVHACGLARTRRVQRLELRGRGALPIGLEPSLHKVASVLELPAAGPDVLFGGFPAKLRSQIRRSEREPLEVSFGHSEIPAFYRVFSAHMTHLGTPTYPLRFFQAIGEEFGDDAWFGCVYLDGAPVAAGLALRFGDEVEMTWAAALTSYSRLAPNMLLYWSFLRRAAEHGLKRFDFGRCTPGSGTHRFKQQWGTRDVQLWWYGYSPVGRSGSTSSDARLSAWGPTLWQKLPVSIARIVGPAIRRGIPL